MFGSLILVFVVTGALAVFGIIIVVLSVISHQSGSGVRQEVAESSEKLKDDKADVSDFEHTRLGTLFNNADARQHSLVKTDIFSEEDEVPFSPQDRGAYSEDNAYALPDKSDSDLSVNELLAQEDVKTENNKDTGDSDVRVVDSDKDDASDESSGHEVTDTPTGEEISDCEQEAEQESEDYTDAASEVDSNADSEDNPSADDTPMPQPPVAGNIVPTVPMPPLPTDEDYRRLSVAVQ